MSLDSANQLKFEIGTTEPLTIMDAGMEEFPFGSKYVVRIEPLITGHDHFMPSPGLEKKIKEINVDVGDVITVEKVAPSEKYTHGYFSVDVVEKGRGPQIAKEREHKSVEKFEKQFEPKSDVDLKIALHELTLRFEKLEKMVTTLSSEAGHKPGDEDIPF